METQASSTRRRPPDEIVPESQNSDAEDQVLQISRIQLIDEIVSESPRSSVSDCEIQPKRQRQSGGWLGLRKRVRDALQQVRVLIFVHVEDPKKCLETRLSAVFRWKTLAWKALLQLHKTSRSDLPDRLLELNTCKEEDVLTVLLSILAYVLHGHVSEYRPLMTKLSTRRRQYLDQAFNASSLNTLEPLYNLPNFMSWFQFQTQANSVRSPRSLQELEVFSHVKKWSRDADVQQEKCAVFDQKAERARTTRPRSTF
ncbi:hypothetical protein V7S43_006046 [Phytophthora oleae]|uniref:Uncharacterized protein n=1 Tax=Phytophthora oleae TaxID=2107226 RepID=A0ABD3FPA8_9STRA